MPISQDRLDEHPTLPWVQCRRFLTQNINPAERVLDVGCGHGELLAIYAAQGCPVAGVEIDPQLVETQRQAGLDVRLGTAEQLPFDDGTFDRIVCSVVVPYTDERLAVREWCRVLRPGGLILATFHGLGYGWDYLLRGDSLPRRIYGLRMLLNTACYRLSRRRLPGFLGDTLCQVPRRLESYYAATAGLVLEHELVIDRRLRYPRFFCHAIRKLDPQRTANRFPQDSRHKPPSGLVPATTARH